jgi:hypothetical protein
MPIRIEAIHPRPSPLTGSDGLLDDGLLDNHFRGEPHTNDSGAGTDHAVEPLDGVGGGQRRRVQPPGQSTESSRTTQWVHPRGVLDLEAEPVTSRELIEAVDGALNGKVRGMTVEGMFPRETAGLRSALNKGAPR